MKPTRCSELPRLRLCPASGTLGALAEARGCEAPRDENPAVEGSRIHEVLADAVRGAGVSGLLELSTRKDVSVLTRVLASRSVRFLDAYLVEGVNTEAVTAYVEEELIVGPLSGTPDVVLLANDREGMQCAFVLDYKSGYWEVERPSLNYQLLAYCLLVMDTHPQASRVYGAVIPAVGDMHTPVKITRKGGDESTARAMIREVLLRAGQQDVPPFPGPRQCEYCRAFGTLCQASREELVKVDASLAGVAATLPSLSDEVLGDLYERASMIEKMRGAIKGEVERRLRDADARGEEREGLNFKLQARCGSPVLEGADALAALEEYDVQPYDVGISVSFAVLAKQIHAGDPAITEAQAMQMLEREWGSKAELPKVSVSVVRKRRKK